MPTSKEKIRNFSIIAHIDHGKSTLADRLLERTGTLREREMQEQVLDTNALERERGITIKLHAVRMDYEAAHGGDYQLNLIDTPGHVDFSYEVSRSLAACEGAVLVVDASQGVQAQTVSNLFLALEAELEVIPVLNKIDLPGAQPERRREELVDLLGVEPEEVLLASAKEGTGVDALLEAIVERVPAPGGDRDAPLRALIFDSYYDQYQGAVPSFRVVDGVLRPGMRISFGAREKEYEVDEIGVMRLGHESREELGPGEVGYLMAAIKGVGDTRVGDTILDAERPAAEMLPGYQESKPMVFSGLYPTDSDQYEELRDALEKMQLNDASLDYEPESSTALGFGFRCGFLGLLHMEIVQERLEREFGLELITTVPNVEYHVVLQDGETMQVENPTAMPDPGGIERIEEPYVRAQILCPSDYIGNVQQLCHDRRGEYVHMDYLDPTRVELVYELPLAEVVLDFYDRLKSWTRGFASLDWEFVDYRPNELVRLDMRINGDPVDAFSVIIHEEKAYEYGRAMAQKLKELIPRQLFEVALQAAIGNNVIARETIRPLRKQVTAKCYGGDVTRKRKLLEKQREGKRRMKSIGTVEIPQEAFLAVLQVNE